MVPSITSLFVLVITFLTLTSASEVQHLESRAACAPFVTIDTRGTNEAPGPSQAFVEIMAKIRKTLPGDFHTYDTKYPAGFDQNSESGTRDIIKRIQSGLKQCPHQKYLLLGVSQGAAATVNALHRIKPNSKLGKAIAGVYLQGNPMHRPKKQSNIDCKGKKSTNGATGMTFLGTGIPAAWDKSGRVMDMCRKGDGVCEGTGLNLEHLLYAFDPKANSVASAFLLKHITPQVKAFKAIVKAQKIKAQKIKAQKANSSKAKRSRKVRARSFGHA